MTTAQVVDTSVTVNNNGPSQDYVHPDDQTKPTFDQINLVKIYYEPIKLLNGLLQLRQASSAILFIYY